MNNKHYKHDTAVHNTSAAKNVLPFLFSKLDISSVLDFGCGLGTWLKVAKELGADRVKGIDADYIDRKLLMIDNDELETVDLRKPYFFNDQKYDLTLCLEVIEHLPSTVSNDVIDCLCKSSDNILFSGAIPLQTGQYHINEQHVEYWAKKFRDRGFLVYDVLRLAFWENENVEWWYKQNMFFVSKHDFTRIGLFPSNNIPIPTLVHYDNYLRKMQLIADYQKGNIQWKTLAGMIYKKIFK